jgi:hypothetical protein
MEISKALVSTYVFLSIAVMIALAVLLHKKKKCENYRKCICSDGQGGRERNCQDTATVNKLYVNGELTESSSFKDKGWSDVSPGDVNFPLSQGCGWSNSVASDMNQGSGWASWDFTDFGN